MDEVLLTLLGILVGSVIGSLIGIYAAHLIIKYILRW